MKSLIVIVTLLSSTLAMADFNEDIQGKKVTCQAGGKDGGTVSIDESRSVISFVATKGQEPMLFSVSHVNSDETTYRTYHAVNAATGDVFLTFSDDEGNLFDTADGFYILENCK